MILCCTKWARAFLLVSIVAMVLVCPTEVAVIDKMYAWREYECEWNTIEPIERKTTRESRCKKTPTNVSIAIKFLAMKLKWMGSMCHCAFYIFLLQYYLRYIQKWAEHIFVAILFVFESTTKCRTIDTLILNFQIRLSKFLWI